MNSKKDKPGSNRDFRSSAERTRVCGPRQMIAGAETDAGGTEQGALPPALVVNEAEQILFALSVAVEQRDRHTSGHCERLAAIAVGLGVTMGLAGRRLSALYRGGFLHDVGKVGIPDSILFKPGPLTTEEWDTMRTHTLLGENICRPLKSLAPVLPIIRHHHERWDGSGYPDGLKGEEIPLLARILQVVDIYDALASPRPYKKAFTSEHALSVIQEETDRGWRDPLVVHAFFRFHEKVLSKIPREFLSRGADADGMRTSLTNLQGVLAADFVPAAFD